MTFKDAFLARVNIIKDSEELTNQITSTSLKDQKRVYKILNVNIKSLNTYVTYIRDLVFHPEIDNHQKTQVCRDMRIYYTGSVEEEAKKVKVRQDLILAIGDLFEDKSSFYKAIFIFLLGLNSLYNLSEGSEYLFDTLPPSLLDHYDEYLKDVLTTKASIVNPAYGTFVFYPDPDLLDAYLDFYNYEVDSFIETLTALEDEKIDFIYRRIKNCQSSALKQEAVLFSLYRMISELNFEGKTYEEVVDLLCDAIEIKLDDLGYPEFDFGSLYTIADGDKEKFKEFLLSLNEDSKNEIFECLGNSSDLGSIESYTWSGKLAKRERVREHEEGEDVVRTSSGRRGQTKFKRNLVNRVKRANGGKCRCEICGCTVEGENYLIASHILPWKHATPEEKVDGNNGLLLCPNHDFLFDGLKITFDETGKIIINDDISDSNKRSFRINLETKITMTPEIEVYMARHRKAFKGKGWGE